MCFCSLIVFQAKQIGVIGGSLIDTLSGVHCVVAGRMEGPGVSDMACSPSSLPLSTYSGSRSDAVGPPMVLVGAFCGTTLRWVTLVRDSRSENLGSATNSPTFLAAAGTASACLFHFFLSIALLRLTAHST